MKVFGLARLTFAVLGLAVLAACDTADERAEGHYQKGVELLEAGDVDRALVELRNVFKLNGEHRDARALYAATVLEQGKVREAFSQYLRLIEQYPEDLEALVVLANLSIDGRQWETAERHVAKALEVDADDFEVQVVDLFMRYRAASLADDSATRLALLDEAEEKLDRAPEKITLHTILIEGAIWQQDFELALQRIDTALEYNPDTEQLYLFRLAALEQLGRVAEIETQLLALTERYPEVDRYRRLVLQFYNQQQQPEKAEAFIRSIVSPSDENPAEYIAFVRYIKDTRGVDAAIEELERANAEAPGRAVLQALEASLIFDLGRRDEGISIMQEIVESNEGDTGNLRFKVALAQMLLATGNEVGARKLVEETLAEDPTNVDAIKLQAAWLIESDETERAISLLRSALDQTPDDPQLMTLIANAHMRNGDRELARDLLSVAAEASSFAPQESLRYARLLLDSEEFLSAEDVLVNSLRAAPNNVQLLVALAETYLRMEDLSRAEHVERTLRALEQANARDAADSIRVAILNAQERPGEALNFLTGLALGEDGSFRALAASVQSLLNAGEIDRAREMVGDALAKDPDDFGVLVLDAATKSALGELEAAEEAYRALTAREDTNERIWLELMRVLNRQDKLDEGRAALAQGLEAFPEGANLLWAQASVLEREGDVDGAIEIYERLYERSSGSVIISNNLASLLSTHRTDEASIERAYRIARRLRGTDNPAFQDTYGWLAYLRGEFDEALAHLEPAAAGLSNDPMVQYHLAMTYLALERNEEAVEQFRRSLSLVDPTDARPQFTSAREELNRLEAANQ